MAGVSGLPIAGGQSIRFIGLRLHRYARTRQYVMGIACVWQSVYSNWTFILKNVFST